MFRPKNTCISVAQMIAAGLRDGMIKLDGELESGLETRVKKKKAPFSKTWERVAVRLVVLVAFSLVTSVMIKIFLHALGIMPTATSVGLFFCSLLGLGLLQLIIHLFVIPGKFPRFLFKLIYRILDKKEL